MRNNKNKHEKHKKRTVFRRASVDHNNPISNNIQDKQNGTFDDIFTIDNPEFEKYIPDIYPAQLHLNKAKLRTKKLFSWI